MHLQAGDTVIVTFPFEEGGGQKVRIGMVMRVEGGQVKVAYGTSQVRAGQAPKGGEFIVDDVRAMRLASLRKPTLFDLSRALWVDGDRVRLIGHVPVHAEPWRSDLEQAFRRLGFVR